MTEFTVVDEDIAAEVRRGSPKKAWFNAILTGQVVRLATRPQLTEKDKELVQSQGYRLRTRYTTFSDKSSTEVYAWLESTSGAGNEIVFDDEGRQTE